MYPCNCSELKTTIFTILITLMLIAFTISSVSYIIQRRRKKLSALDSEGAKYLHGLIGFMTKANICNWKDHRDQQLKSYSRKYNPNKKAIDQSLIED